MLQRIVLALSFLLLTAPARAQDEAAEARAKMAEGNAAVKRGDFAAAVVAYKAAYVIKQHPVVLQNLGMAEIHAEQFVEGARHLAKLLASGETIDDRKTVEKFFAKAEDRVGRIEIKVNTPGAEVAVGGDVVGRSPLRTAWHVRPGKHRVEARLDGYVTASEFVGAAAGASVAVELKLVPETASATPAAGAGGAAGTGGAAGAGGASPNGDGNASSDSTRTIVLVGGAALTAVSAAVAVGFTIAKGNAKDDADALHAETTRDLGADNCQVGIKACDELMDANKRGRRAETLSTIGFVGVGVGLAALATALLWPSQTKDSSTTAVRVGGAASQSSIHMSLGGAF